MLDGISDQYRRVVNNRAKDYDKEKVPFLDNMRPTTKLNGPSLNIVLHMGKSIECFNLKPHVKM